MSLDYSANVLADSISPDSVRLTTLQVTHPRFILAEINTHRMMSRNSASSRAIPPELQIARVLESAFVPETFNERVKGMGVGDAVSAELQEIARGIWLEGADYAVDVAKRLNDLGLDKSRVNRILEPFMWHTAIITATEWSNFFALRDNSGAQPEFQIIAKMMREVMWESEPTSLDYGEWHLPGINADELSGLCDARNDPAYRGDMGIDEILNQYKRVSARRMARVSFDKVDEHELWSTSVDRAGVLMTNGHVSPLEHISRPLEPVDMHDDNLADKLMISMRTAVQADFDEPDVFRGTKGFGINPAAVWAGNFRGWLQFRKELPNEDNFARHLAEQEAPA